MRQIGIFEAKTRLSQICAEVAKNGEEILVTRRGDPLVRIVPAQKESIPASEVWEAWESYTAGEDFTEDFVAPSRKTDSIRNPFSDSDA
jgi:prevent-host-death family protein